MRRPDQPRFLTSTDETKSFFATTGTFFGRSQIPNDNFLNRLPTDYAYHLGELLNFLHTIPNNLPTLSQSTALQVIVLESDAALQNPGRFLDLQILDNFPANSSERVQLRRTVGRLFFDQADELTLPGQTLNVATLHPQSGPSNVLLTYNDRTIIDLNIGDPNKSLIQAEIKKMRRQPRRFAVLRAGLI